MSNNDPKPKGKAGWVISAAVAALIAAGASSDKIAEQFIGEKEGNKLVAYYDAGGVPTICGGITGKDVRIGDVETAEGCARRNKAMHAAKFAELDRLVKVPLSEPAKAGIMSFCTYNIGSGKCRNSTFLAMLNDPKVPRAEACAQIRRWIFDGGKDCRVRANNCAGQVVRREQEEYLCMQ